MSFQRKIRSFRNATLACRPCLLLAAVIMSLGVQAHAANVPNFSQTVDLNVREQNVIDFIEALFRDIGVPVIIDESIEGTVNGRFNDSAENVFKEVTSAFDVVVYFDGAVAHAYRANALLRTVIPISAGNARRVISSTNAMNLPDTANQLSLSDGGLLVTGTERFVEQVREVVTSVEGNATRARKPVSAPKAPASTPSATVDSDVTIDSDALVYEVFRLDHAWADDTSFTVGGQSIVIPGVATILSDLISTSPFTYGMSDASELVDTNTVTGLRGQGLLQSPAASNIAGNSSSDNLSASNLAAGSSSEAHDDGIRIVADTRLNAVIIRDKADRMPGYARLIDNLDVESGMVEIEATIVDINTDMSRELGINWRYQLDEGDVLFGQGTAADQALLPGSELITPQGQGGILSLALGEPADFLARINLLEERGAARIVSKPHVITLSDLEAVLGATTEFFVRIAGDQQVDLFNVPVGTVLRVTPHIFKDNGVNRIKMQVNIEDGSQSSTQSVDRIPVVERANISTQAVVNEGDSLLIGGLVRDVYRKSDYRVPVLGSIPLLGRLFRSDRNTSTRVERLFMITPRVATGLGFGASRDLPTLQGDMNDVLADSRRRLDGVQWPQESDMNYWPETHDNVRKSEPVDKIPATPNVSGFTVEPWPIAKGLQP